MAKDKDRPTFRGFNPHAPMRIYRRHLPHWRQDGATYFVTFRLADSIPKQVLLKWQEQDRLWLKARGIDLPAGLSAGRFCGPSTPVYDALPLKDRQEFERRTARRLHLELDCCHGTCLLRKKDARKIACESLRHFHGNRWWVGDFVIMPNHVHGLWQPMDGYKLEAVLASVKGYISTCLTKAGIKHSKLWQQENYDRLVRDRKELAVWRKYIERNPGKAGLKELEYTYQRCDWLD